MLVLLIGRSTRLSRYVTGLEKTYTATARFGATSDTLDAAGNITPLANAPMPDESAIRATLPSFTGDLLQIPPMASALKRRGVRLYSLHRRGVSVEREARPISVHSLCLLDLDPREQKATFEVTCSSGTYVRTLISDLARDLATDAYLIALRRTSVGHLKLEDATSLANLTPQILLDRIIPPHRVVAHLPGVELPQDSAFGVCHGRRIEASLEGVFRVEVAGELLAIYRGEGGEARPEVVLCEG